MVVNFKTKQCFIHLPKSGGTSVRDRLLEKSKHWNVLGDAHDRTSDFEELRGFEFVAIVREPDDWYKSMFRYSELTALPERDMFMANTIWERVLLIWKDKFPLWQKNAANMNWRFVNKLFQYNATFDLLRHSSYEVGWYTNRLNYQLKGLRNLKLFKFENINLVFDHYNIDPLITNETTLRLNLSMYTSNLFRDSEAIKIHNDAT